jgi:hypothetical protein
MRDAEFIVSLRTNNSLNKYISAVEDNVDLQKLWLSDYKMRESAGSEHYFIIESLAGESLGTVRLYDFRDKSFCWGSWVIKPGVSPSTSIESALAVYEFGFYELGFQRSHFEVNRDNLKVVKFHSGFGASVTSFDDVNYYFLFEKAEYEKTKLKYEKFFDRLRS